MPNDCVEDSMAKIVNCGLGLGNEDLHQSMLPSGQMLADMILQGMQDFKCVDLNTCPSENKDTFSRRLSCTQTCPDQENSPVIQDMSSSDDPEKDISSDIASNYNPRTDQSFDYSHMPSNQSFMYFLPMNYNKRNPWRRISGFHTTAFELRSATYPARSSVKKLRFAQAKKSLNYLYSYFSVHILDCDEGSGVMVGVSRKDYPSKIAPGKSAGSIGYFSDNGCIFLRDSIQERGPMFSKGDIIGCGIIYPSHYKKYADLSTDDNSDGMTDIVLTSLLNKKSMDFVCNVLNLSKHEDMCDDEANESNYYNENFVESRTQVEIYFTCNMQVIGKVNSHVPIGGFFPTIHVFSSSAIKMNVDLNPPSS